MMEVDFVPEHLVVLGGSYIGLEFAQMYRRFGARVTVIELAPRLVAREDPDISAAILGFLQDEGIEIRVGAEAVRVDAPATVHLKGGERVEGTHLLVAIGRVPNTGDLGLPRAGIEVDARGYIRVDDQLATTAAGVWAMGDCNGKGAFTHTSYNDYEIVAANLLDGGARRVSDRITTYGLFTDPPLGRAGMTEDEARRAVPHALAGQLPMTRVGRARERGETKGLMKIVVDGDSQRILGASLLGIEGDEVVHAVLDLMYAGAPYTTLKRAMHIHPTVAEYLPVLVEQLKPLE
jgi:pyruvate/2-oxoglutarate dehydrogenase complex dihydrolipoamide dehydrogenase (E3) component